MAQGQKVKATPNTERRTPNTEWEDRTSALDVARWTSGVRRLLGYRSAWRILEFIVGAIFIYAGVIKVLDPVGFAGDIDNYKLLPWPISVWLSFYLPWLEILCGLTLVARRLYLGGLGILTALTSLFLGASIVAKIRGIDITCGCFGHVSKNWSFSTHLFLDLALLTGLFLLARNSPRTPHFPLDVGR
jgi:putative oxidoreductase